MKLRAHILILGALAFSQGGPSAWAGAVESSYRQARGLIDHSLAQMEVSAWLEQPTAFLVETRGTLDQSAEHQGVRGESPTPSPFHETWGWDPVTGTVGREYRQIHADGYDEWIREVFTGSGELWRFDLTSEDIRHFTGPDVATRRDRILRRFMPLLLAEALDHAAALRFTGRFGPFDSVQMQTDENEPLSLFFGRESRHLSWVEYLTDLPTFGDSTVSWKFSDYQPVGGIGTLPQNISVHVNDRPFLDMNVVGIDTDNARVAAFLALNEISQASARPQPQTRLEAMGEGVYRIADAGMGRHMLAVEFQDFLLVVDAPAARPLLNELPASLVSQAAGKSAMSRKALHLLQNALPGKPVRYLVLSHFHSDSAGGVLAFSELETELITSQAQSAQLSDFLAHSHTLDDIEPDTDNLHLVSVSERHQVRDESQSVDILEVGPNPHSENMLVAWMPGAEILWAADLQRSVAGQPDRNQQDLNRFFDRWIAEQGIEPKLILTAGGDGIIRPGDRLRVDAEQTHNLPRDP